ncbi:MAG: CinA family protein [Candidatus Omnitrophica bacterium]|nr:CinA family protein [Candidatus Omnitrophota bacterium]
MQDIAAKTHKLLIKNKQTLAVAESCTGGLLSSILTSRSGSSEFFVLGVVVYSNLSKQLLLKVPMSMLNKRGAVSRPVAITLAQNIRNFAKTDYGIGITGIAGPTGGTAAKPVGTVFISVSSKTKLICRRFQFKGTRSFIRQQSCLWALKLLQKIIN